MGFNGPLGLLIIHVLHVIVELRHLSPKLYSPRAPRLAFSQVLLPHRVPLRLVFLVLLLGIIGNLLKFCALGVAQSVLLRVVGHDLLVFFHELGLETLLVRLAFRDVIKQPRLFF